MFAGQNKHWGTIEEATEFWLGFGIDNIMVKRDDYMKLIDKNGNAVKGEFKKLGRLQKEYNVKYNVHPFEMSVNDVFLSASIKESHKILKRFLTDLDDKIQKYDLYPLITLHFGEIVSHKYNINLDEKTALDNAVEFFQGLNLKSKLAVETMHHPSRKPKHTLLGYKADHFLKIAGNGYGICVDTGHMNMAEDKSLESFLSLPLPIYIVHLDGNDGTKDAHKIPTKYNVGNFGDVVRVLKKCEEANGIITFEITNYDYSANEVKECVDFWKNVLEQSS